MTTVFTALALIASAVFFWQITRPTSFLSGILGVEYSRLMPPERANGEPTWNTIYEELKARTAGEPFAAKHLATAQLLRAVIEVERGRREAAGMLPTARQVCASDAENWISRLALASLVDSTMGGKTPTERFEAWREVVEQPSMPKISTLYNEVYDRAWEELLRRHIKRFDVRANLAHWMDHGEIRDHYAALPMVQAQLTSLAVELQTAGRTAESESCRRWVVRACLGLMEYEPDAGTRLLCADLAARCLPEDDDVRKGLLQLRTDYHARLAQSVPDLTSFNRSFVHNPAYYQLMLGRFFATSALAMAGIGAAILTAISLLTALVRRCPSGSGSPARSIPVLTEIGLFAVAVLMAYIGSRLATNLYSESCIFVRLLTMFGIGLIAPGVLSHLSIKGTWFTAVRVIASGLVMLVLFAVALAAGDSLALLIRSFDSRGGALIYEGIIIFVGLAVGVTLPGTAYFRVARNSALLWLICTVLALGGWTLVNVMDSDFSPNLARARVDELQWTLGSDWKAKYRVPSAPAFDSGAFKSTP